MSNIDLNSQIPEEIIKKRSLLEWVKIILLSAFLYYVTARLGFFLTFNHTVILPLWPPAGVALALMLIYGRAFVWPGIAIATFFISVRAPWNTPDLPLYVQISVTALVAFARVVEALAADWAVKKYIGSDWFSKPQNTFRFLYITLLISVIGSGIAIISLYAFGITPINDLKILMFDYWFGNVVGILLFTPLIIIISTYKFKIPSQKNILDFIFFILLVIVIVLMLQIERLSKPLIQALPFMTLPYLLWLAFRYGLIVSFTGVFIAALLSLYYTVIVGSGPFIISSGEHSMLYLQVFIAVISFSSLLLSASMSELATAQNELKKLNENLEEKVEERTKELTKRNTELDSFVYSVSHDLRSPIASILGLLNLAKNDKSEAREEYLDLMYRSAVKQENFIREILDHSRNSRIKIHRNEIHFAKLIDEVLQDMQFVGRTIDKTISIKQEGPFYSDAWRLTVILNNIISNSIRYGKGDSVNIKITGDISTSKASIVIEDNGIGIGKEHIENVFKMFYRASEDAKGSGLGLYIVKETVDKLEGQVSIASTVGKGTTVTLIIPGLK